MEGMERIRDSIMEEANAQAASIVKEAEDKAREIAEEAAQKAQTISKVRFEKSEVEAAEAAKRMLSMAELELRKESLAAKQNLIDIAFDRALDRLKNLSDKEYRAMVVSMLRKAGVVGGEELVVSPKDRKTFQAGLLKDINRELGVELKLSEETKNIQGGFILKARGVEINNSFETLLRMEREQIETEIADILFQK